MRNSSLRIAVVGGSIAGCTAAIALRRAGHEVEILERNRAGLMDRGAGIIAPVPVIESMQARDLLDADLPAFQADRLVNSARCGDARLGHSPWAAPVAIKLLRWRDLYASLRRRVEDRVFRAGCAVTDARHVDDGQAVELDVEGVGPERYDLAVFADGYRSLGRQLLFPDRGLRYTGIAGLRGLMAERHLADPGPLEGALHRVGYDQGHFVFYLVPGEEGRTGPGERIVNWGVYLQVPEADLPGLLTDASGNTGFGSVAFGEVPAERIDRLRRFLAPRVPPYFAGIVTSQHNRYALQAMFTVDLPAYRRGRLCLAGDAGIIAPPFTGSGVFKGMTNAVDLADALAADGDLDARLETWSREQTRTGQAQLRLGERLADALIWNIPDFAAMSEAAMIDWWERASKFPEEVWGESGSD